MARNEEKHAGRLNRLWLQQLDEEKQKKNPPRPGLGSLSTAAEVKKWIPSIKRDIDFYLKQSQVGCYPERQIADFSVKIESLTREYRAYIRKLRDLDPDRRASEAWTDRAYSKKLRKLGHNSPTVTNNSEVSAGRSSSAIQLPVEAFKPLSTPILEPFTPLSTPILDQDHFQEEVYGYTVQAPVVIENVNPFIADKPLEFIQNKQVSDTGPCSGVEEKCAIMNNEKVCADCTVTHDKSFDLSEQQCTGNQRVEGHTGVEKTTTITMADVGNTTIGKDDLQDTGCGTSNNAKDLKTDRVMDTKGRANPLGITYSDSEEEDDETGIT